MPYPSMQCMIIAGILREQRENHRGKPGFMFVAAALDKVVRTTANRLERDNPGVFDREAFFKACKYNDRLGLPARSSQRMGALQLPDAMRPRPRTQDVPTRKDLL